MPPFRGLLTAGQPQNYSAPQATPVDFKEGRSDAEGQMNQMEKEIDALETQRQVRGLNHQELRRYHALSQMYGDLVGTYELSKGRHDADMTTGDIVAGQTKVGRAKRKLLKGVGEEAE